MKITDKKIIFLALVVFGIVYRIVQPHPANVAPIGAIALFSGFFFRRYWAFAVPVVVLLITDFFLGYYEWKLMMAVYGSFMLIAFIGMGIKKTGSILPVITGSLAGSIIFFIVTNFSVWVFGNWYPHDLAGLAHCYYLALPFFRNTLLGDMFFAGVIFGSYELALYIKHRFVLKNDSQEYSSVHKF